MATTYTFTPVARAEHERFAAHKAKVGVLNLAGTYTTGGDAPTAAIFGLSVLEGIIFCDGITSAAHVVRRIASTGKIVLYESAATGLVMVEAGSGEATTGTINVIALGY